MRVLCFIFLCVLCVGDVSAANGPVRYQVQGETFEGYYLSPAAHAPLVLLVHDWDGLTAYEIKRAEMLAGLGYAVFAVDLFGAGIRPDTVEEKKQRTSVLYNDRGRMRLLLRGGLEAAKAQGGNTANGVAMGYCFGGAAVLELARSGVDLKGFVSFHGGLETPEGQDYKATKGKLLILHGTADSAVSMEQFAALADTLEERGVAHEMITYGGAPHGFTVFGTDRYREDADKKSWNRFAEFLEQTLR
ncbi:MAG: dienelactone hydrolase family protein [Desulfobulbaceae bacterium]|jgi:dienelactone hydrolase|nr:dienelactone hydrolase family protein [Desulfobulbaceae bacterium]